MPFWRYISETKVRLLIATMGGLALAAAFPNLGISGMAWIAPGIILTSGTGCRSGGEAFRMGWVAGVAHYLLSLYWLLCIPYQWLGLPLAPALGWLALAAFLALFMGAWVWLVTRTAGFFQNGLRTNSASGMGLPGNSPEVGSGFAAVSQSTWSGRALTALFGAIAWVGMEMFITRIFGGFPWNLLGASQYQLIPLLQVAEYTGVYGVSFLPVWFALSLTGIRIATVRQQPLVLLASDILLPGMVALVVFFIGYRHVADAQSTAITKSVRVAMIQPSIPQGQIWDAANDDARFRQLIEMSEQALTNRPQLLVWPEAAVPKLLRYDEQVFNSVTNLAAKYRVWMIIGADDAEPVLETPNTKDARYYNSSFLISPEGHLLRSYRKQGLVIFGEYIPLVKWMPFLSWFTPIQGGFTAGTEAVPFDMQDVGLNTSVLICYEDIFPQFGRSAVDLSTDFLVNITNDGWFGESAAQWQHATSAILRAVENRMPLIRCTNNGLTCWIDELGRLRAVQRDSKGTIYGESMAVYDVPLPPKRATQTFYNQHGDVFGWICSGLSLAAVLTVSICQMRAGKHRRSTS